MIFGVDFGPILSGLERGLFWKVPFLEMLENLEILRLEILKNPQTEKNKGESDHSLEILENLEDLEISELQTHPTLHRLTRSKYDRKHTRICSL